MTPPRSDRSFVQGPDAEFGAMLARAAEKGAKRALVDVSTDRQIADALSIVCARTGEQPCGQLSRETLVRVLYELTGMSVNSDHSPPLDRQPCLAGENRGATEQKNMRENIMQDVTMRITLAAMFVFAGAGLAAAQATLSIPLKPGTSDSVQSQIYACDGGDPFPVQYVNAGDNALAILPVDGEERIFVNVVSASGAKYVSGAHVWWSKGESATLENEMEQQGIQNCSSQDPAATN